MSLLRQYGNPNLASLVSPRNFDLVEDYLFLAGEVHNGRAVAEYIEGTMLVTPWTSFKHIDWTYQTNNICFPGGIFDLQPPGRTLSIMAFPSLSSHKDMVVMTAVGGSAGSQDF